MKTIFIVILIATASFITSTSYSSVVLSSTVVSQEQNLYTKSQVLNYFDSAEVQSKLISLGVDAKLAKYRIANLTDAELANFNEQINDAPAGGIVGTIITVFVVLAVLDLLGVTDVFSFIKPI